MKAVGEYALAVLILLESGSVYWASEYSKYVSLSLAMMSVFVVICEMLRHASEIRNRVPQIVMCVCVSLVPALVFVVLLLLRSADLPARKILLLCVFVPSMLAYFILTGIQHVKEVFFVRLLNVFLIISVIGFLFWVAQFFQVGVNTNSALYLLNWGKPRTIDGFFGLSFNTQVYFSETAPLPSQLGVVYRFTSLYVESPAFAAIILMFLLLALFWMDKASWPKIALLFVFGFASMSTTFILLGPVLLPVKYIFHLQGLKREKKLSARVYLIKMVSISVFLASIAIVLCLIFLSKTDTISGNFHLNDFKAGWKSFTDAPILGHGIGNWEAAWGQYMPYKDSASMTSAALSILAQGGLLLMLPYAIPVLLLFGLSDSMKDNIVLTLVFVLICFICMVEDFALVHLFMGLGYFAFSERFIAQGIKSRQLISD